MHFVKYNVCCNNFIVINSITYKKNFAKLAKLLCCDKNGVGADGLIVLTGGKKCDFGMRIFNKDGSEAEMSANGIRALAHYLTNNSANLRKQTLTIETKAGVKKLLVEKYSKDKTKVRLVNVVVDFNPQKVIHLTKNTIKSSNHKTLNLPYKLTLNVAYERISGYVVSVGNPHFVIPLNGVMSIKRDIFKNREKLMRIASETEKQKTFINGVNISFFEEFDKEHLGALFWERGVGETYCCGTGCIAISAVLHSLKSAGVETRNLETKLRITTLGGEVETLVNSQGVTLSSYVQRIFDGYINC